MNVKTMKMKLMSVALVAAMVVSLLGLTAATSSTAYAAENDITVYVTVSDAGKLATDAEGTVIANVPVTVPANEDGLATVDEALTAFHEIYCPDGYATIDTDYGLSVSKLWDVENGGSYLFAIDGMKCNSGVGYDYIGDGQYLTAIVMSDLVYWSDLYAFFDKTAAEVEVGEEITLTLAYDEVTYDENWNPAHAAKPISTADIYVAGDDSVLAVPDAEGKAVVSFDEPGTYIITAFGAVSMQVQDWAQGGAFVDADAPISAPACVITVTAPEEPEDNLPVGDDAVQENADEENLPEEPVKPENNVEDEDEDTDAEEQPTEKEDAKVETEAEEKAPSTGDASQTALYVVLLAAAVSGMLFAMKKQK